MKYPPLYILRHGQTEWNAEHRIQGRLDSELTKVGRAQAKMQFDILKQRDMQGFTAFSSPQGRAVKTANIALDGFFEHIEPDPRLAEIGVGDWEGLHRQDIAPDRQVNESEESTLDLYDIAPGGEGLNGLRKRCQQFLNEISGPAVLVTHGVTSRMLRLIVLDMDTCEIGTLPGGQGVVYYLSDGMQIKLTKGA